MELLTTSISYQFNPTDGTSTAVTVGLRGNGDKLTTTFNVQLTNESLDEGQTLDDLSRKDLTALATKKAPDALMQADTFSYETKVTSDHVESVKATVTNTFEGSYCYVTATLSGDDLDLDTSSMATVKEAILTIAKKEFALE